MPQKPTTRDAAAALVRAGGMTAEEIAAALGKSKSALQATIRYDRERNGTASFRVSGYRAMRGKGGRPQPVYEPGPGQDADRPSLGTTDNRRATQARYRDKMREAINERLKLRRRRKRAASQVNHYLQLIQK